MKDSQWLTDNGNHLPEISAANVRCGAVLAYRSGRRHAAGGKSGLEELLASGKMAYFS
jgi:hypothetical protein